MNGDMNPCLTLTVASGRMKKSAVVGSVYDSHSPLLPELGQKRGIIVDFRIISNVEKS